MGDYEIDVPASTAAAKPTKKPKPGKPKPSKKGGKKGC